MLRLGSKVKVLPYEVLKSTCSGIDEDGDLCFGNEHFVEEMNEYCERTGEIVDILIGETVSKEYLIIFDDEDEINEFYFTDAMIEEVVAGEDNRPTIVFSFDGVINSFESGYVTVYECPDPPVEGIKEALDELHKDGYYIVVQSSRCRKKGGVEIIRDYLNKYDIWADRITAERVPAIAYIDSKSIGFTGTTQNLINRIKEFKPWYEVKDE